MTDLPRLLPIAPLLPWINERIEAETVEGFAERVGWSARRIAEFTSGRSNRITFDKLDQFLAKEGSRSIIDFYPEYDDDVAFAEYEKEVAPAKPKSRRTCSVDGCDVAHHSKGLCASHYGKQMRPKKNKVTA